MNKKTLTSTVSEGFTLAEVLITLVIIGVIAASVNPFVLIFINTPYQ